MASCLLLIARLVPRVFSWKGGHSADFGVYLGSNRRKGQMWQIAGAYRRLAVRPVRTLQSSGAPPVLWHKFIFRANAGHSPEQTSLNYLRIVHNFTDRRLSGLGATATRHRVEA